MLPRLDYGSQLWSPLIEHITQQEEMQRSITEPITGMHDIPYHERLKVLDSTRCSEYKSTAVSIFGKLVRAWLLTFLILLHVHFLNVEAGHASFPMQCSLYIIVLDGVQFVSSIVYQCIYVQITCVQFLDSSLNLIYS